MRFEYQHVLWLLLVLPPALLVFFWWSWRKRQMLMTQFIQARLLSTLTVGLSPTRQKIRFGCLVGAVAFVIVALARPQWGYHYEEVKQRGLDIVVAIDTSKSMLAEDIAPNRLSRAKLAALDLMQQARSDRLGLVAFAGGAFLQCPLTIDDTAFRQSVGMLDVNIIPQGGTAIAEAINTALTAFKESDNYKVLVLFTDGEDNDEGALAAAQAAAKEGLRIFTVGVGTAEGELLRISDNKGRTDYVRDEQGNVVKSHLNETLLEQIASATEGGFYLHLAGAKTIDVLYEKGLAPLPKSEQAARLVRQYHEQFHWPLAVAILLLFVEMLLPEARRESKRRIVNVSKPTTVVAGATAALVLIFLPGLASGSSSSALRDYKTGKFKDALKEYQHELQIHTNDVRLYFNAGAAAYRLTNYDAAIRYFTPVLTAQDVKLQQAAYFNLGNIQYRLGAQAKSLDSMQEQWETAIKTYQNAVALDKNDADAAFNLAFVQNNVKMIIELREAARRAKEAADDATRRRNYHRALEIMEQLMANNPTAKQFEDFTKRLKDIDAIATPNQP